MTDLERLIFALISMKMFYYSELFQAFLKGLLSK